MKKLLALVLCVMMFVAVIPTAAFAGAPYPTPAPAAGGPGYPTISSTDYARTIVDDARDALKYAYGTIVANETVWTTVKAADDVFVSMANNIFKDYEPYDNGDPTAAQAKGSVKAALRTYVGTVIKGKLLADQDYYYDSVSGTFNPEKYLKKYISAYEKALTSKEAAKYIEGVLTTAMANAMIPTVKQHMSDLKDAIADWEDGSSIWNNSETGYGFTDSEDMKLIDDFGTWELPIDEDSVLIGDPTNFFNTQADN